MSHSSHRWRLLAHDVFLLSMMMVLAACGLIYEYLLSHYAGRVLGIMETTIYAMIGLMIVAMGLGAWSAKFFKQQFTVFAWLEAIVALLGVSSVIAIAGIIALAGTLPEQLADTYNLPPDTILNGGFISQIQTWARYLPYVAGFLLGFFIGMEIPLIARVREHVYGQHLENNVGTIYGADYIGAGIGAVIWVTLMLSMDITLAAVWTALLNIIAGSLFLWRYWRAIKWRKILLVFHAVLGFWLVIVAQNGERWMSDFANVLYRDQVFYQTNTKFQNITFTKRSYGTRETPVVDMYLNGRLQFSSYDESIYHTMLTYPALMASAKTDNILIIGGGDGMALRDALKWNPTSITLVDLDKGLVDLFSEKHAITKNEEANRLRNLLMQINESAFEDPRVNVVFADAFLDVETQLEAQKRYDTIIIDLPDPSHPDLNKLYSDYFYARLRQLLSPDGVLVAQSTSPFHAQHAFISMGKTMKAAGFQHVEQYRQNVPSFGEWGWTIATVKGQPASTRIKNRGKLPIPNDYLTEALLLGAFALPANFYHAADSVKVNYLGSGVIYQYHTKAWQNEVGVYRQQADRSSR